MHWLPRHRGPNASGGGDGPCSTYTKESGVSITFRSMFIVCMYASLIACAGAMDITVGGMSHEDDMTDLTGGNFVPSNYDSSAPTVEEDYESAVSTPVDSSAVTDTDSIPKMQYIEICNDVLGLKYIRELPFKLLDTDASMCKCDRSSGGEYPNEDCIGYFYLARVDSLCTALNLHPGYAMTNETTGFHLDQIQPWESEENFGRGDNPEDYDDFEDHENNSDIMSWYTHCGSMIAFPIHRQGPFRFVVSGTSISNEHSHPFERNNNEPGPQPDRDEEHNADDDQCDADCEGDPCDDDLCDDDVCVGNSDKDDKDDGDVSSDSVDAYEDSYHTQLEAYLQFGIFPMHLQELTAVNTKLKRSWGQNARRRYEIRVGESDNITR